MIKFFRNYRKQHITENKFGNYLKYAIGEIVLVVIGILIAVQINAFYNKQIEKATNERLLHRLVEELKLNIERIDYLDYRMKVIGHLRNYTENEKNLDSIIKILNRGITIYDLDFLVENDELNKSSFNLHESVYEEMLNTGKIYNVGSDSLINEIHEYYKLINREDNYHKNNRERTLDLFYDCKYGWNDFIYDYSNDKLKAIEKHSWLFDASSKNYIDYKLYIKNAYALIVRSIERVHGLKEASTHLINSIENRLKTN